MDELRDRWPRSVEAHAELCDRLLEAYAGADRGYHDLRHLSEVLEHVDLLLAQPEAAGVDRDVVVLAAWFHDVVYDGGPDDEERSARLAAETLAAAGWPAGPAAEVARLVRLTRHHDPAPDDLAGQVLSDADLAILAAPPDRYADYVRGVRQEYAHLDDATFAQGRARVLRTLLSRRALFRTPLARRRWEEPARTNLAEEVAELTG